MFRGANLEYFPYGETWVHNKASSDQESTPYKFTAKELDPETGLYYHGARYRDARVGLWLSVDPILNVYLDGEPAEGIYNPINLNLYHYASNNPMMYNDPTGMWQDPVDKPEIRSHQGGRFDPNSNKFGRSNRFNGKRGHGAIDLRTNIGQKGYAVGDGTIIRSDDRGTGLGQTIVLEFKYNYKLKNRFHDLLRGKINEYKEKSEMHGKTFYAWYCHLSERKVKEGDLVKEGQIIGLTGDSQSPVPESEDHLHFAITEKYHPGGSHSKPNKHFRDPSKFFQNLNSNPKDNRKWKKK